jgi:hypothetical protein
MSEERKLNEKERRQRRAATIEFLSSTFYQKYFEPWLDEKIDQYGKINSINDQDDNEIIKTYKVAKNKRDIFRGIKNRFQEWIK